MSHTDYPYDSDRSYDPDREQGDERHRDPYADAHASRPGAQGNAGGAATGHHRPTHGNRPDAVERTFAALPPAHGRGFAQTWWGQRWLKALEDTALDNQQLKKGRKHARDGAVGAVSVRPGRITAVVRGQDGTPYRSDVLLRELTEAEWDRLLDMVADQSGHIAALLDRDMPPHLVEDAAAAGVELLPGIGDLEPECGCEAWDHCPHTSALCYQLARLLDQDPFVLLLLRGRGERDLLDDLQARSAARAAPHAPGRAAVAPTPQTVPAREVFAMAVAIPPLPEPPPPVPEPGRPPRLGGDAATVGTPSPGVAGPLDTDALEFLAADAAARAHRLLAQALAPGHEQVPVREELTEGQDAVRLATANPAAPIVARLAAGCGRGRADLDRAALAWEHGGPDALAVLDERWAPGPDALARAGVQLSQAWEEPERPRLRADGNRWTVVGADAQLRYGQDGRWWPYRKERGHWCPAGPAAGDPATALAGALGED
ncbi:SWIM zinc finger family protein [Streptomyces zagrosensis]|uniref:Putative Zn finger protein n=1 Tax=Streptomyces zagrosensis TaxID=1042984 RepID=A0A7W9QCX4_9ACTN|nr:SWF or SNF family helicase [Streptomyces zagrosensis]MBB5937789.1 putative Zn finger protein [Streptomyces zagrosensis]